MMEPERVLALEGATNFRDLGGYRTAGGGRTRWGRVFRSDSPHRLTTADLAVVQKLGLRCVYDLRTDEEREHSPSALPAGLRRETLPIGGGAKETSGIGALFAEGRFAEIPPDFLDRVYRAMIDHGAPVFGRLLTGLADPARLPALVHCTAGKDRTGLGSALLLTVLGVDEETVLDDYELSAAHYSAPRMARMRERIAKAGIDEARYLAVFGTPRQAMATALAVLRDEYGSVERYLLDRAGLSPGVLDALRTHLVEPAQAGPGASSRSAEPAM
ncbi:tyrosine-protein phosphatase [Spirillospora sp. CA-255316]